MAIQGRANICIDCERACGGCSWSEVDPETWKIRFEPVPGWDAEEVLLKNTSNKKGSSVVTTYRIKACPLFEGEEFKIKQDNKQLSEAENKWFLENVRNILRRWADGN